MNDYIFKSKRLGFRQWLDKDLIPFSLLNSDEEVMKLFPKTLSQEETKVLIEKTTKMFEEYGYGLYAVDRLDSQEFIGFIGFGHSSHSSYSKCIEIGWCIKKEEWNKSYATEGSIRCLDYGFKTFNFKNVYAFTSKVNLKSEKIMQKVGMQKVGEFDHPKIKAGSVLKPYIAYRIRSS